MAMWHNMASEIWVNTGSENDLLIDGTQAIAWNNVELPSTKPLGIHSRVMFTLILKISIPKFCLKFTRLKSKSYLPGDNELNFYTCILESLKVTTTHLKAKCMNSHQHLNPN